MPRQNDRLYEEKQGQQALRDLARELRQTPHRMEVWFAELHREEWSYLRNGILPVLVVSDDRFNTCSTMVTVVPLRAREIRMDLPTHVRLLSERNPRLDRDLTILAEQITTIDKASLRRKVGEITSEDDIQEVELALLALIGLEVEEV